MYQAANYIHLQRLFWLRNLAILGQVSAVLFVHFGLQISISLLPIVLIVLQIILFNAFVGIRLKQSKPVTENEIFIHLAIDVLALSMLLYFTGGASNPFVLLFLFPLTITVTILPIRYAWLLAVMTIVCYSLLMFNYQPLPMAHDMSGHAHHMQTEQSEYDLHLMGMWLAFILNAALITYYVYGMGATLRQQQKQLASAREQAIRDEQLVILGTLAASTAHELGTPLGTMALLVSELEEEISDDSELVKKDLITLKQQISRCKNSLSDLSASVGASSDLYGGRIIAVNEYLDTLATEIKQIRPEANLQLQWDATKTDKMIFADRTLSLAIINIVENAIDVSPDFVAWHAEWDEAELIIKVFDQGPGLSSQALEKIGQQPYSEKQLGLGLGLYLAHAAIRRKGGTIEQSNRDTGGSRTLVTLPLVIEE